MLPVRAVTKKPVYDTDSEIFGNVLKVMVSQFTMPNENKFDVTLVHGHLSPGALNKYI